ncbi:oxidative phosphorylation uncoupler [Mactra antiquata]
MSSSHSQPCQQVAVQTDLTLSNKLLSAGVAAIVADVITFPLDTAKVRLQIRNSSKFSVTDKLRLAVNGLQLAHASTISTMSSTVSSSLTTVKSPGTLIGTLSSICKNEGARAMYSGLSAGLQRQMCFASIKIGLYDDAKATYQKLIGQDVCSSPHVLVRLLSGLTTGAVCVVVAQPTDIVKIKMQAAGAQPGPSPYSGGLLKAYSNIYNTSGIKGLWKGYLSNVMKNSVTNMAEIVTYDLLKEHVLLYGYMRDNFLCHASCGFAAGLVATVVSSPLDVVKTRYTSSNPGQYNGALDCAKQIVSANGIRGLYKGCTPSVIRFGSRNIITFVIYEQMKKLMSSETSLMFA